MLPGGVARSTDEIRRRSVNRQARHCGPTNGVTPPTRIGHGQSMPRQAGVRGAPKIPTEDIADLAINEPDRRNSTGLRADKCPLVRRRNAMPTSAAVRRVKDNRSATSGRANARMGKDPTHPSRNERNRDRNRTNTPSRVTAGDGPWRRPRFIPTRKIVLRSTSRRREKARNAGRDNTSGPGQKPHTLQTSGMRKRLGLHRRGKDVKCRSRTGTGTAQAR